MKPKAPTFGYILPKWNQSGQYRATALAYLQREKEDFVQHFNGYFYSINDLKDAMYL